ncbi:MAG: beta-N-acetylhexosaminidase [Ktedonobacteraceae bacterium]
MNLRRAIVCASFALLIVVGSIAGGLYGIGALPGSRTAADKAFMQPPLDEQQIAKLQHIAERMQYKQLAGLYVARMSLDEEIGQVIMVEYSTGFYSPDLTTMIHDLHAGGVIMYQGQINTLEQTQHDTAQMQQQATFPLLIGVDEEGWNVHRLTNIYPPRKSAGDIHDAGSVQLASSEGTKVAHDLLSLGINTNFAPDVDVSKVENYIGYDWRAFGDTPADVIKYAGSYLRAMQAGGAIGTLKHFPGLGDVPRTTDPHGTLAVVNHTVEQINSIDLAPFAHFIQSQDPMEQPGMIMSTDVLVPALDPKLVAEISPTIMTNVLRKQLGYDGVAITDALIMLGLQIDGRHLDLPEAGVRALNAGNDLLLGPSDPTTMRSLVDAIKAALNDGTLPKSRLDEAATRVLALKMQRHLMLAVPPQA